MSDARAVLTALGDPTRQNIIEHLAAEPRSVGVLADMLPITRPAVSQHLKVLKDAGLVSETVDGTRRIYRLDPRGIGVLRSWLDKNWEDALSAFKAFADADEKTRDAD